MNYNNKNYTGKNNNGRNNGRNGNGKYHNPRAGKNGGNNFHHTTQRAVTIDVESVYRKLRDAIETRTAYQKRQDELWARIKRTHCDGHAEMTAIDNRIGQETHKINVLISELCKYRKTHKAMNLAESYLSSEIKRIAKITEKTERTIYQVNRGGGCLINSHGTRHTDTSDLEGYLAQKKNQMAKLEKWKQYVSQHRVA